MLDHPTLDLLHELGLHGMARGFRELAQNPEAGNLQHGEWLAILLEHEATLRRQKRAYCSRCSAFGFGKRYLRSNRLGRRLTPGSSRSR